MMNKADLLKLSLDAVTERDEEYGKVERNFTEIADFWSLHVRNRHDVTVVFTPQDVASMMILLKLARLAHSPDHTDSMIDISGYSACWADLSHEPPVKLAREIK